MDWKRELGIQIREARTDTFLKQSELGRQGDVHTNMIGRYERGEAAPELDVLIRLSAALRKKEFRIGNYKVCISRLDAAEVMDPLDAPRQMRLEYGREYLFGCQSSSIKIQAKKEGLLIAPDASKSIA